MSEKREQAYAEVFRLCNGGRWSMTIPVNESKDSDIILCRALDEAGVTEGRMALIQGLLDAFGDDVPGGTAEFLVSQIRAVLATPASSVAAGQGEVDGRG